MWKTLPSCPLDWHKMQFHLKEKFDIQSRWQRLERVKLSLWKRICKRSKIIGNSLSSSGIEFPSSKFASFLVISPESSVKQALLLLINKHKNASADRPMINYLWIHNARQLSEWIQIDVASFCPIHPSIVLINNPEERSTAELTDDGLSPLLTASFRRDVIYLD